MDPDDHEHSHPSDDPDDPSGRGECQDALDTLYHYLDGELSEERRVLIRTHLDRCSSCLETYDFEAELKIVVARRCRETVPPALLARVAAALVAAPARGTDGDPHPSGGAG